ncbi:MAG TPA: hypothetical protein VND92_10660 [Vicinamibacterales bacterium]|nr:hypothetical protein [Vicinamibacterales bacterium]
MTDASPRMILTAGDRVVIAAAIVLPVTAGLTRYLAAGSILAFVAALLAVGVLAALVGRCVEQLAERLGSGATGVLQSALGNLPELFIGVFALRAGLVTVVQAAIVGSVLANVLLVLGASFVVGGQRHGVQRFSSQRARSLTALMMTAVAAMLVPSLASYVRTPASAHESVLSSVTAVVLLIVFALSVPSSLRRTAAEKPPPPEPEERPRWPVGFAVSLLAVTGALAAVVSSWFVDALAPAIVTLHISQAFAGLVIVAIAGNAVENVAGIQLAARNRPDHALSVILNSPLQISLVLAPVLVLASHVVGGAVLTLVFPPLLVTTLVAAVLVVAMIINDGESTWLEGAALIGLYIVVATAFWWG